MVKPDGVNMTGMPAFGKVQPDEQIWRIAAFLHKARTISVGEFQKLTGGCTDVIARSGNTMNCPDPSDRLDS